MQEQKVPGWNGTRTRGRLNFDPEIRITLPEDFPDDEDDRGELDFESLALPVPVALEPTCTDEVHYRAYAEETERDRRRWRHRALSKRKAKGREIDKEPDRLTRVVVRQNIRAAEGLTRGGTLEVEEWESWRDAFGGECAYCGRVITDECIEHVVPLSRLGENTIFNVVPACGHCNMAKGTKEAIDWMDRTGRLRGFVERVTVALTEMEAPHVS